MLGKNSTPLSSTRDLQNSSTPSAPLYRGNATHEPSGRFQSKRTRYFAKNIVASEISTHCEVLLAYSIGVADPVSLSIDTKGTGLIDDEKIAKLVRSIFPLKPADIIQHLDLKRSFYQPLASYGHFGKKDYPREKVDMVDKIKNYFKELMI